ncbi:MAG: bifunctional UDP-N-acetylglucosamine diphosphorylase/glucosamine-1-phosphate N-acetyltransferase GlmU [Synergistetes bacterium]|nr:bifunctional UDP-N-acetylglucosamine diphosphorylase/glucosamine-1-phosphate N-acetyltransferase GlmU [Synergistota bacterium]
MKRSFLILAAGKGKRMKTSIPKVLHELCGKPMLSYLIETLKELEGNVGVVVGYNGEMIEDLLFGEEVKIIWQSEQRGTGDAVRVAYDFWKDDDLLVVLPGDVPLVSSETLKELISYHDKEGNIITFLSVILDDPTDYGRVIRKAGGEVVKIVEEPDASYEEKEVKEVNAGIYAFDVPFLRDFIVKVGRENAQGEYYLTDLIEIAVEGGFRVNAIPVSDPLEVMGVNDRKALAFLEKELIKRKLDELMLEEGVTIKDPSTTYIHPEVQVGKDTIIYPMTFIEGRTKIGKGCKIGPNVRILDSEIEDEVIIRENVVIEGSKISRGCEVGPFAYLRPETVMDEGAYVGKFVEVKKSFIGRDSKVPHLSYIGDATIGQRVNVGAGTITCNYDGVRKNPTYIEDDVFIGSDTMLVAPVKLGRGAMTGAGSVITKNVPPDSLAIARSKQVNIEGWVKKKRGGKGKDG